MAAGDNGALLPELDELDLRIIGQLHDDGRKPSTEIARALRVPRTTVARRIERLVRDGVITIGVFANGSRIGLPVHAMILLQVSPSHYHAVVAAIVALVEIRWVGVLSGPFDLLVEAMLPSNEALRHLLLDKLAKIDGITQMQTAQVLEVAKIAFDWNQMLQVDGRSETPRELGRSLPRLRPDQYLADGRKGGVGSREEEGSKYG
jgi:Lrp/AsnC family transcriptional regulator for asnA, asnC and gidA